jgi:hypothetical protein
MILQSQRSVPLLIVLAGFAALWSTLISSSEKMSPLRVAADLERELELYRSIEARLAANQIYSPCRSYTQGGYVPWAQCGIEQEGRKPNRSILRRAAEIQDVDPYTSGRAYLIGAEDLDDIENSISRLEVAFRREPKSLARANDLAGALIERAGRQNQPADLVAALEILEQALLGGQSAPWLLFNRALVLEKLQLLTLARTAWAHYLKFDADSDWATEGRLHLAKLETRIKTQTVARQLQNASELINVSLLRKLAKRFPREVREFASEAGLRHWGEAILAGHADKAERWLLSMHILGVELVRLEGDRTVFDATETIRHIRRRSRQEKLMLARAHQLYGRGHHFFKERDYISAEPLLTRANLYLAKAGSPVAGWVKFDLSVIELYNSQNYKAIALLSSLLADYDLVRYPSLCGRAAWVKGLALFRLGRLEEALNTYRMAEAAFVLARELDNQAAAQGLIAETLRELGDTQSAWQYRYHGLHVLGGQTRHHSIHNILWEGGDAALEEGYPLAAKFFADEDVLLFGNRPDRLLALEAYLRRALLLRGRAPTPVVLADLERASEISRKLPFSPLLPRIEAEIQLAFAELAVEGGSAKAEEVMGQSLEFFRDHRLALREAVTLLARARARRKLGSIHLAQEDLRAAVKLFEEQREQLTREADQRLYSETWYGVYDELISFEAMRPDGARKALELLERSRSEGAFDRSAVSMLNPSTTVITYSLQADALYRFQLKGGILHLEAHVVNRDIIVDKVRDFVGSRQFGLNAKSASVELAHLLLPSRLPAGARLCFVPDQELSGVPFAALPMPGGGGLLVAHHEVVLANSVPDCAGTPYIPDLAGREHILLVGSPKLDSLKFPRLAGLSAATDEVGFLKKLYPRATLLTGAGANVSALLEYLPDATLFHFVGHAVAHPTDSRRSFVPLALDPILPQASLLSASDVAKLPLANLKLAVLSGCDTLGSRSHSAEGVSGLGRALLDAGARAVIGTLWSVEDKESYRFMTDFYKRLRHTKNAATALREAQLSSLSSRGPSDWAAFELVVRRQD